MFEAIREQELLNLFQASPAASRQAPVSQSKPAFASHRLPEALLEQSAFNDRYRPGYRTSYT
ncbi:MULTISPECIES: hypothetical protein [unclassified Agarivorans]|uniref:hypothetical protein n=1 Tax=unclassified Agarivorans TaxID=2636026 RepID=UPI003D7E3DF9